MYHWLQIRLKSTTHYENTAQCIENSQNPPGNGEKEEQTKTNQQTLWCFGLRLDGWEISSVRAVILFFFYKQYLAMSKVDTWSRESLQPNGASGANGSSPLIHCAPDPGEGKRIWNSYEMRCSRWNHFLRLKKKKKSLTNWQRLPCTNFLFSALWLCNCSRT